VTLLLIAVGAMIGAPLRYLTDRVVQSRHDTLFPWGTFAVNLTGSAVLGFVAGLPVGAALSALVGTGLCGALTTYSTFGFETLRLAEEGAGLMAFLNVAASVTAGFAVAFAGMCLAQSL
jgi:CrcB protein